MTRALIAVTVAVALGGCGFSSRKHNAQELVDAAQKLQRVGTGHGALVLAVKVKKSTNGFNSAAAGVSSFSAPPVGLQLDFAHHQATVAPSQAMSTPATKEAAGSAGLAAAVSSAGGRFAGATPPAVFIGSSVFLQRPIAADQAATESQFGVRSWSKLDFAKVGKKETNTLGGIGIVNPINPTYLFQLLAGTLSGSVRRLGPSSVNGVATTHFEMNVDRAKAFSRLPDKDRQAIDKAFSSDNVKGSVYRHAEAWLDAGGLPRRLILRLNQQIDQDNVFTLTYSLDLSDVGSPVEIHPPGSDATAEVTTLNALLNSARS